MPLILINKPLQMDVQANKNSITFAFSLRGDQKCSNYDSLGHRV